MNKRTILIYVCVVLLMLVPNLVVGQEAVPIKLCDFGEKRCNGNIIEACSESGSTWIQLRACEEACILNALGDTTCVSKSKLKGTPSVKSLMFPILLVFFIVWMTRKPAKADESGESYY